MIGKLLNAPVNERVFGGVALNVIGYTLGARIFRVHDVRATVDALKVADQINMRFKKQECAA
jgi:dihydropteroate synthase